ncbi:MAG TPA: hypothetical protein VK751_19695 [Undibacterium sp.]|jgi:hypothetical protein|nr:hypothetical protein [Undibacterium sp.]
MVLKPQEQFNIPEKRGFADQTQQETGAQLAHPSMLSCKFRGAETVPMGRAVRNIF